MKVTLRKPLYGRIGRVWRRLVPDSKIKVHRHDAYDLTYTVPKLMVPLLDELIKGCGKFGSFPPSDEPDDSEQSIHNREEQEYQAWVKTLGRIRDTFQSYVDEQTDPDFEGPREMSIDELKERYAKLRAWREEGLRLFVENFDSLWW